jgi:hypothetical protein
MNVVMTPEAEELVRSRGGPLFVWVDRQRCCGGATYLATAWERPRGRMFQRIDGPGGSELHFDDGGLRPPDELHLDIRGRRRRRVEAYWNGCVFVT